MWFKRKCIRKLNYWCWIRKVLEVFSTGTQVSDYFCVDYESMVRYHYWTKSAVYLDCCLPYFVEGLRIGRELKWRRDAGVVVHGRLAKLQHHSKDQELTRGKPCCSISFCCFPLASHYDECCKNGKQIEDLTKSEYENWPFLLFLSSRQSFPATLPSYATILSPTFLYILFFSLFVLIWIGNWGIENHGTFQCRLISLKNVII